MEEPSHLEENDKRRTIGKGNIKLGEIVIEDVALVKGLRYNLISICQLCDKGYGICFKEGVCMGRSKDSSQTFSGKRYDNIYLLNINRDTTHYMISIREKKSFYTRK